MLWAVRGEPYSRTFPNQSVCAIAGHAIGCAENQCGAITSVDALPLATLSRGVSQKVTRAVREALGPAFDVIEVRV